MLIFVDLYVVFASVSAFSSISLLVPSSIFILSDIFSYLISNFVAFSNSVSSPKYMFPLYIGVFLSSPLISTAPSISASILAVVFPIYCVLFSSYNVTIVFMFNSVPFMSSSLSNTYVTNILSSPLLFHVTIPSFSLFKIFIVNIFVSLSNLYSFSDILFAPFVALVPLDDTFTSSTSFGASISNTVLFIGYPFPFKTFVTNTCTTLFSSPFMLYSLFVTTLLPTSTFSVSLVYGLSNTSFSSLSAFIVISFLLLLTYVPSSEILLLVFNIFKLYWSSFIGVIPTSASIFSPAVTWFNVIVFPSILLIPFPILSLFNVKLLFSTCTFPLKYPSFSTPTSMYIFKSFVSILSDKLVTFSPSFVIK